MHYESTFGWPYGDENYGRIHHQQVSRLRDCRLPELQEFRRHLESLPYLRMVEFESVFVDGPTAKRVEDVPVSRILGCTFGSDTGWYFTDRGNFEIPPEEYVWNFARKIKEGSYLVDIDDPDVHLVAIGDVYFITVNGTHRVAALKGLLGENITVRAFVERRTSYDVVECSDRSGKVTFKDDQLRYQSRMLKKTPDPLLTLPLVEQRRRDGLWNGSLFHVGVDPKPAWRNKLFGYTVNRVVWRVGSVTAPWVFAAELENVRKVYEQVVGS